MNRTETVTNRILQQLRAGVLPWRKSWRLGLPRNLTTGKEYRGINILMLKQRRFLFPLLADVSAGAAIGRLRGAPGGNCQCGAEKEKKRNAMFHTDYSDESRVQPR